MSLFRPLVLSLAVVFSLTACNKTDSNAQAPKTDTATQAKSEAPKQQAPANYLDTSPTVLMMADMLKVGAWAYIHATGAANNMTEEQMECLFNYDKALFLEAGKAETTKMLSEELIRKSDEFYHTEVGKKMLKFMEQTQLQAQGKPINGEAVVITEEDKAKMAEFGQSEAGQKIAQATGAGVDPQAVQALVKELGDKEKARCKLS